MNEVIVARVCLECGKLILSNKTIYCNEVCRDRYYYKRYNTQYCNRLSKPEPLPKGKNNVPKRMKEKYEIAREYLYKNYGRLMTDQRTEALGTYATASMFNQCIGCKMIRNRDGTPNFGKELEAVKVLKAKTFNGKSVKSIHSITEGDIIRNEVYRKD